MMLYAFLLRVKTVWYNSCLTSKSKDGYFMLLPNLNWLLVYNDQDCGHIVLGFLFLCVLVKF